MSAEFEKRIVAALKDNNLSAADWAELVTATEIAIVEADAEAEIAREALLDPARSPDANKARAKVEATEFAADRLRTLLPRVRDQYRKVAAAEDLKEWYAKQNKLKVGCDALAAELSEVYPRFEAAMVDLLTRVAIHNRAVDELHLSRPAGAKGQLLDPELVGRGVESFTRDAPSITRELQIPDWQQSSKLAFPLKGLSAGVEVALSMPTSHPRYSRDWSEEHKADIARRVAEENTRIEREAAHTAEDKAAYERSLPR